MKHLVLTSLLISLFSWTLSAQSAGGSSSASAAVEVRVYPNPAVDYIQLSSNDMIAEVAIYNLAGSKVRSFRYSNGERYFVGDLPRGMYLVQMINSSGRNLNTRRLSIKPV